VIADAQLAATSDPDNGGADIAFMNPGGVRADLAAGDVTYGEAFAVQPFSNFLVTMDLTGEQIERLLEAIDDRPGGREVLIFGVSEGFSFAYNPEGDFGDRIDPGSITLNGVVLDPRATYRIVTNSFLADGGDSFSVFTRGHQPGGPRRRPGRLRGLLDANSPVSPSPDRIDGI
jgi:5'-nucleotidase